MSPPVVKLIALIFFAWLNYVVLKSIRNAKNKADTTDPVPNISELSISERKTMLRQDIAEMNKRL